MRNIKSTLRMTRNSGMLFAAVSGLLYLTACTSDVLYDAPNENITESNVIIGNDPAAQAHRIHFFGNQGTRGGEDVLNGVFPEIPDYSTFTMKKCPKFDTPNAAQQSQDENKKIAYELTGGEGQIELYGGEVYITGNVTTHNFNPDNGNYGTVYVMPGAKLTLKDEVNNSSAKIVVWGEIEAKGTITNGTYGQILVNKDLYVKELNNGGTVVVNGNLTIEKPLQFNGGTGKVKGKCIYIKESRISDPIHQES